MCTLCASQKVYNGAPSIPSCALLGGGLRVRAFENTVMKSYMLHFNIVWSFNEAKDALKCRILKFKC